LLPNGSFPILNPYCQPVDLFTTPYTAKLALKVFPWIGAVVFFLIVLDFSLEPLHDAVTHTRIDIHVQDLKSVSDRRASESKFASHPIAQGD
jgi:hypothetical protein